MTYRQHKTQHASILAITLVIIALGALIVAGKLYRVGAESRVSTLAESEDHARAAALSGVEMATMIVARNPDNPELWLDNPDLFQARFVNNYGGQDWYFTIYAHNPEDPEQPRYGIADEAARLNLNHITPDALLKLTDMDESKIDALLDAIDEDDEARPLGAEQQDYNENYNIKNGPFTTPEELLMIKGFDAAMVYGEDTNFNQRLDPNEDDLDETFPADNGDGILDRGLRQWFTTTSATQEIPRMGQQKVDINGNFRPIYALDLEGITQEYIRQHRLQRGPIAHPGQLLQAQFISNNGRRVRSGVDQESLPDIMNKLTANVEDTPKALVNILTVDHTVLATLPGMDDTIAGRVIDARNELTDEDKQNTAWLYTRGLVDAETFREVSPYLTTRSDTFRITCVGYGLPSGKFSVIEVVIKIQRGQARVVYQRDLTHMGLPIELTDEAEVGP